MLAPGLGKRPLEREKWFRPPRNAVAHAIEPDTAQKQIALLRILVGCGDKAVEAFQAADNPLDAEFVEDLKRIIERSRDELAVLVEHQRAAAK
jgi:hypothetical protein